jgi:hypothetical protein
MKARAELSEGRLVFVLMDDNGNAIAVIQQATTCPSLKKFLKLVHDMIDD